MWAAFGLIGFSLILQAFELINFQVRDENWSLKSTQVEELRRARELIPTDGPVIVLGNGGLREWAPYLLQREVLNTEFGLEWQPAEYREIISANKALAEAENWKGIAEAIRSLTNQKVVYVILDPNRVSRRVDIEEQRPFFVTRNSSDLQVGSLELP